MGAGLHKGPSVVHEASKVANDPDKYYNNYTYNRVYASAEKDVEINGETVTLTKGLILPVEILRDGIDGTDLTGIYLLGNVKQTETLL